MRHGTSNAGYAGSSPVGSTKAALMVGNLGEKFLNKAEFKNS